MAQFSKYTKRFLEAQENILELLLRRVASMASMET